jgi:Flp pilus assembly protein TadB
MTRQCEYCKNTYPDNVLRCPNCGSYKFIELEKHEEEQRRREAERKAQLEEERRRAEEEERKAKQKRITSGILRSTGFLVLGFGLWMVVLFLLMVPVAILALSFNASPEHPVVLGWTLIVLFLSLYLGFRLSYKYTIKRKLR